MWICGCATQPMNCHLLMVLICRSCVKSVPKYNRENRFGEKVLQTDFKRRGVIVETRFADINEDYG